MFAFKLLINAICLFLLATFSAAVPSHVETLIREFAEKNLVDGVLPQVARTVAFMKKGKAHMHVELAGITHDFLLEPTSAFSKDMTVSVGNGRGVENRRAPKQYSYLLVDENNADVSGIAIVHKNGHNKQLSYKHGGAEYILEGFPKKYNKSGYSFFYAAKDVKKDPSLTDEVLTPPENRRRSESTKKASAKSHTGTNAPLITSDELPEIHADFGHYGHAGHVGGDLHRQRRNIGGMKVAELVLDLDAEYVAQFESVEDAIADASDHINAVNNHYLDSGLVHVIKSITVRTASQPNYQAQEIYALLDEVFNTWNGQSDDDLTMLFTGRTWSSGTIGLAYINTVCWRDYNIGVSQLNLQRLSNFVTRVQLVAHELGHNWGCGHVDNIVENQGYVMFPSVSYAETKFGPICRGILAGQKESATCLSLMVVDEPCAVSPCVTGSCSVLTDDLTGVATAVCTCEPGFTGQLCEVDINECATNACSQGNTKECVDGVNSYTCICNDGFNGDFCENNIDDCAANDCVNGSCEDLIADYMCLCQDGWQGSRCDIEIVQPPTDYCASASCQNGASCENLIDTFKCICITGYTGDNCEIVEDNCNHQLCQHGGACVNGVGAYTCNCEGTGFTGEFCAENVDDCANNPCGDNFVCVDGINTYTCEDVDECAVNNQCKNGATCVNTPGDYQCICQTGYAGKNCDEVIDNCSPNQCQNQGVCVNAIGSYTCQCVNGYTGANCETAPTPVNPCDTYTACQNGGTCAVNGANQPTCSCPTTHTGTFCETEVVVNSTPCVNGRLHFHRRRGEICKCYRGWKGAACDTPK